MTYSNKKWYKPTKLSSKLIITAALILFIRLLANIPVPFINREYLSILFADTSAYALLNNFSGGAFTNMTLMALGVTPYISASIILQLLQITFPKLKDIQQDGEVGKRRWKIANVLTGIGLGVLQAIGIAVTLGRRGLFTTYNVGSVAVVTLCWVLGAAIVILAGEYISKFCVGNGVSLILAANIISELPGDVLTFYQTCIKNRTWYVIAISCFVFLVVMVGLIAATILLTTAQKEIPVMYPKSANAAYKNTSSIPMKLNAAGVMPVIFTSTLFSIPLMFLSISGNKVLNSIIYMCSSRYWYTAQPTVSQTICGIIGVLVYGLFVITFAYFYTAITFNPNEIAQRLRKKGACIPGIRPGTPTEMYLYNKQKYMTFIGAVMLFALTQIPTIITQTTNMGSLSFGGTSVIIVVGVVMETTMAIRAAMASKSYAVRMNKTFLGMEASKLSASN